MFTGMKHVRGILLYGAPGTGKTLMARQIGKMLHARVIDGTLILDKHVGQSEANIRQLFAEPKAKAEKKSGINSALYISPEILDKFGQPIRQLFAEAGVEEKSGINNTPHIIVIDEIDAIGRQRGSVSDSTGVHDAVVNQLLSKLVEENNTLLIGITNRKDIIDEALLQPGCLEIQMEIGLPDAKGRFEILNIHTAKMRDSDKLGKDVDLEELAEVTRNFSGAEIEGLVRSATSTAMNRMISAKDRVEVDHNEADKLQVTRTDFQFALEHDIKPAFGISEKELDFYVRNGIIHWSPRIQGILSCGKLAVQQTQEFSHNYLISLLIKGAPGSGKTALAVQMAKESAFPFVKVISPENMIGYHESAKCQMINKVFEDAYKSPISCIVIDDIESLLDYVSVGPRFSNLVLQALLVLLRKQPPARHRLLILGTTSLSNETLSSLGIENAFSDSVTSHSVTEGSEVIEINKQINLFEQSDLSYLEKELKGKKLRIGIKKLIALSDAACQSKDAVADFVSLLETEANLSSDHY